MRNGWMEPCSVQMGEKFYDCDALSYVVPGPLVFAGMRACIAGDMDFDEFQEMLDKFEAAGKELREEFACQL